MVRVTPRLGRFLQQAAKGVSAAVGRILKRRLPLIKRRGSDCIFVRLNIFSLRNGCGDMERIIETKTTNCSETNIAIAYYPLYGAFAATESLMPTIF
jgi:hypothetical protein